MREILLIYNLNLNEKMVICMIVASILLCISSLLFCKKHINIGYKLSLVGCCMYVTAIMIAIGIL